jgi:hypothetical protein
MLILWIDLKNIEGSAIFELRRNTRNWSIMEKILEEVKTFLNFYMKEYDLILHERLRDCLTSI